MSLLFAYFAAIGASNVFWCLLSSNGVKQHLSKSFGHWDGSLYQQLSLATHPRPSPWFWGFWGWCAAGCARGWIEWSISRKWWVWCKLPGDPGGSGWDETHPKVFLLLDRSQRSTWELSTQPIYAWDLHGLSGKVHEWSGGQPATLQSSHEAKARGLWIWGTFQIFKIFKIFRPRSLLEEGRLHSLRLGLVDMDPILHSCTAFSVAFSNPGWRSMDLLPKLIFGNHTWFLHIPSICRPEEIWREGFCKDLCISSHHRAVWLFHPPSLFPQHFPQQV